MNVLLTIDGDCPERLDYFRKKMLALKEVAHFYHVTGDADIIPTVVTGTMEDYARFTERHFYEPYIERFESIVVLREAPCRRDIEIIILSPFPRSFAERRRPPGADLRGRIRRFPCLPVVKAYLLVK